MNTKGDNLYVRARSRIPGGTQLLSKRPEMFLPEQWPNYYSRAHGVEIWDLDDKKYTDMSYNGIGACILGAADPDVDEAVKGAIDSGSMATLNAPEEVALADLLCQIHPWASMVRYTRSGGEAMTVAVRIARAATGRELIAFCGYHGWHDWYLAANLSEDQALDGHLLPGLAPAGVPRGLVNTALPFRYNRLEELQSIVARHGDRLAAVVMEPVRDQAPRDDFLLRVRELAVHAGAVLIFDEITAGFRLNTGGAHALYHVEPDMAVFAKALSNGYPMAAIIGRSNVMQAAQDTFISSTNWTERIGPVAALATILKHRRCQVPVHLIRLGLRMQEGWSALAAETGTALEIGGIPPLSHFRFLDTDHQASRTLFTQLMLERGFLATNAFYVTYAHKDEHLDLYFDAAKEAFKTVARAQKSKSVTRLLKGPVAHSGFQRLT